MHVLIKEVILLAGSAHFKGADVMEILLFFMSKKLKGIAFKTSFRKLSAFLPLNKLC